MFQNTRNKKVLVTKWFLAFPAMFLPTNTSFRFRKMVKWSPKVVTFLVQLRACCAVVSKLSTLFGFVAHCKTRGFNISLHKLLNSILLKTKRLICLKIALFFIFFVFCNRCMCKIVKKSLQQIQSCENALFSVLRKAINIIFMYLLDSFIVQY